MRGRNIGPASVASNILSRRTVLAQETVGTLFVPEINYQEGFPLMLR